MTKRSSIPAGVSGKQRPRKAASASRSGPPSRPQASSPAQRRAAAVLEVLAGVRTPPEAAAVLGISAAAYYLLERRALEGLTAACEPKPKGRGVPGPQQKLAAQAREVQRLRRECQRQAALVRATQRAVGLPAAAPAKGSAKQAAAGGKRRRRRATVRALRAAEALQKTALASGPADEVEPRLPEATAAASPAEAGAGSAAASGGGRSTQPG